MVLVRVAMRVIYVRVNAYRVDVGRSVLLVVGGHRRRVQTVVSGLRVTLNFLDVGQSVLVEGRCLHPVVSMKSVWMECVSISTFTDVTTLSVLRTKSV